MSIDIICPLYNAEKYIENLNASILRQKNVSLNKIRYILTESNDKTEDILNERKLYYTKIKKKDFSHSLSREQEAFKSEAEILVFITQDIIIEDDNWLYNLIKDIQNNICAAAFSKQISKSLGIEKYTREKNYPSHSYYVSKKDITRLGLMAFFFSDASSAIKKEIFVKLNGYDQKRLSINEDMYIAHKLIIENYMIKYCADSQIIHSHNFTLKEIYKRYYDTGLFFQQNPYLNNYNVGKAGGSMAIYILKRSIEELNYRALIRFLPDMAARYLGMKRGNKNGKN